MEEALGAMHSSLTGPLPELLPAPALNAGSALPAQLPLEIVDEMPATTHDDMDLDAPL